MISYFKCDQWSEGTHLTESRYRYHFQQLSLFCLKKLVCIILLNPSKHLNAIFKAQNNNWKTTYKESLQVNISLQEYVLTKWVSKGNGRKGNLYHSFHMLIKILFICNTTCWNFLLTSLFKVIVPRFFILGNCHQWPKLHFNFGKLVFYVQCRVKRNSIFTLSSYERVGICFKI